MPRTSDKLPLWSARMTTDTGTCLRTCSIPSESAVAQLAKNSVLFMEYGR